MDYVNINIRKAEEKDILSILEIENLCFKDPWKQSDIEYEMKDNPVSYFWVIELSSNSVKDTPIVGFCIFWITFDSATICQIAVHPEIQRRQLGTAMVDEIVNECYAKKVRNLTLEVRKSNQNAIKFYEKQGFKVTLEKTNYYADGEDAIYMMMEIK